MANTALHFTKCKLSRQQCKRLLFLQAPSVACMQKSDGYSAPIWCFPGWPLGFKAMAVTCRSKVDQLIQKAANERNRGVKLLSKVVGPIVDALARSAQ